MSLFVLLALGVSVGWASVETYRLWIATQQVAATQQQEIRVAAKLEAARARHYQLANTDASARPTPANPK